MSTALVSVVKVICCIQCCLVTYSNNTNRLSLSLFAVCSSLSTDETLCLLLMIGADINAQTDETQETALTLACCGGFLEVADFLIKAAADIELGCSTPLMEAAQEGHLELVKYLLKAGLYTTHPVLLPTVLNISKLVDWICVADTVVMC